MSMPSNDNQAANSIFNANAMVAGFWKLVPLIAGALGAIGWIPKEWVDYIQQNVGTLAAAVAPILAGAAVFYNFWKNRPAKLVADTAKIPGVDIAAPADLAAKAQAAANADAKSSIVAKAA